MATQVLPTQQVHAIPFPLPLETINETITQAQLERILRLRNSIAALKDDLESCEATVRKALEAGAEIEVGIHTASLKESKRRNVSWKVIAERLARRIYGEAQGAAYCARVLAGTKPSTTVTVEVQ